ncbi:MAG TPA: hypothetical protein VL335_03270 [Candidatus Paceibacterota bacterium]|nr:hypothetical protein [Candidatus Paceibacterota bacterium]
MSYTFLPFDEQKKIKREYRIRALIVLLFFLSVSIFIGVGSLFPAYVYSVYAERLHLQQVAEFKKSVDSNSIAATQKQLSESVRLISALDPYIKPSPYYDTVAAIVDVKGNVRIDSMVFEYTSDKMKIGLSGSAPTRNDLLAFKSRLMGLSKKVIVDLPISSLTRDTNVSFSIQVTETLQ